MAGDKLKINQGLQKIKKTVGVTSVHRQPSIIHFCQDERFIIVESKDFKQVVQKLTGQDDNDKPNRKNCKETSVTKKAKNVSDLSIVTADPPAPNEVSSALPSTLVDSLPGAQPTISRDEYFKRQSV